jgi:hypothetical protein
VTIPWDAVLLGLVAWTIVGWQWALDVNTAEYHSGALNAAVRR